MKVRNIGLGIVLGVALAASPVLAQDPKGGGGAPGGGASERTGGGGAAANSGSGVSGGNVGGGGGSVASGGSSGSSSSGVSFNSPSGNGATASNLSFGDRGFREARPAHRPGYSAANSTSTGVSDSDQKASPRTASGSNNASGGNNGGGERAVPRGSSGGSGSNNASGSGNNRVRTPPASGSGENNSAGAREVPNWSRPRGDRPATGTAVDRVGPPPDPDHGNHGGRYYDPYYYGGGYYGSYYSPYYSCGYGYYYGCSYPWSFGLGYGLYSGFGWNPYIGDPSMMYGGGGYYEGSGGYSSGVYNTRDQGSLKLKVKPRNAKVYVDGYFAGLVDQFDGAFQKLALNGGRHKVEIRADGFESAEFDVLITPDQTVTFQGELKRIQ